MCTWRIVLDADFDELSSTPPLPLHLDELCHSEYLYAHPCVCVFCLMSIPLFCVSHKSAFSYSSLIFVLVKYVRVEEKINMNFGLDYVVYSFFED